MNLFTRLALFIALFMLLVLPVVACSSATPLTDPAVVPTANVPPTATKAAPAPTAVRTPTTARPVATVIPAKSPAVLEETEVSVTPGEMKARIRWLNGGSNTVLPGTVLSVVPAGQVPMPSISPAQAVVTILGLVLLQNTPALQRYLAEHQVTTAKWTVGSPTLDLSAFLVVGASNITSQVGKKAVLNNYGETQVVSYDWISNLLIQTYNLTESELARYTNELLVRATAADLEWTDQVPLLPGYVRDHTIAKHSLAVNCFKYLVASRLLAPRIMESWVTDIRAKNMPRVGFLVWLANLPGACADVGASLNKTSQKGGTPVIAVIVDIDPLTGLLAANPSSRLPYPPVTVFETTREAWNSSPGVRCGIYNQFPMTVRIWPLPVLTLPCPGLINPQMSGGR